MPVVLTVEHSTYKRREHTVSLESPVLFHSESLYKYVQRFLDIQYDVNSSILKAEKESS